MSDTETSVFKILNAINVNDKVEKKQDLTYLSWSDAWSEVKKLYPEANYKIWRDENNIPYVFDEKTGYMVYTSVTIEGLTHEMWLPVMDGANKAMKAEPYDYNVVKWINGQKQIQVRTVDACTMFDINKTIMRCLTKNLAMFGLALYIYAKEDMPEVFDNVKIMDKTSEENVQKPATRALIELKTGTENWERASHFIVMNKQAGFEKIMNQLHRKYTISAAVSKQIEKLINS